MQLPFCFSKGNFQYIAIIFYRHSYYSYIVFFDIVFMKASRLHIAALVMSNVDIIDEMKYTNSLFRMLHAKNCILQ